MKHFTRVHYCSDCLLARFCMSLIFFQTLVLEFAMYDRCWSLLHRRLYMLLLFKAYKTQLYGSSSIPLYLLLSRVKTADFQIQNINTFKK